MNAITKRLRIIGLSLIFSAPIAVVLCGGCKRSAPQAPQASVPSTATARANALAFLADKLKQAQAGKLDAYYLNYHVPMWQRAMEKLEATPATGPIDPIPVLAIVSFTGDRPSALSLLWLEAGFDVRGMQLTDEVGELARLQEHMVDPSGRPEDVKSPSTTFVRTQTFSLAIGTEPAATRPTRGSRSVISLARVPKGRTSLILLFGSGKQSVPHEVLLAGTESGTGDNGIKLNRKGVRSQ